MSVAEQQMVSVPDTSTLFMARRGELRLIKRPIRQTRNVEGNPADTIPGEAVAFHDGVLRVPPRGKVRLDDGREGDAADILEWLQRHPLKGDWEEGFWQVDHTAPPPSQAELDTLQELAMDLDADGLERFIAQELDGWERQELIEVAEKSLARVREKSLESQEARAQALAQARAEGAAQGKGKASEKA
jgi:hypothetical protein